MRESAQDRHSIQVERVARRRLKGANAALTENDLAVPRSKDVLGGEQPLFDRAREAALQHHRHARAPYGVEQREVLHVARPHLKHICELGDHVDLCRLHHLGDDREPSALSRLGEETQAVKAEPLEGVRRGAWLECTATQECCPRIGHALRHFKELIT
jgi:hypothetical protein